MVLKVYKTNLSGGFYDVANQVDEEVITLLQLMESMFDVGFLDVSDMRWLTPTKTFRKNGK